MNGQLPYDKIFYPLLVAIHRALFECHIFCKTNNIEDLSAEIPQINSCFKEFEKFYKSGTNKHISSGLSLTDQQRRLIFPRLSRLTIQAYKESQTISKKSDFSGTIPSPLSILYNALIVPSEPQTSAYSLVLCRTMLFFAMNLLPGKKEKNFDNHFSYFDENDIIDSLSSFRKYIKIQLRWPDQRENRQSSGLTSKINFLVGHYLSMKGYSHLWFNTENELENFLQKELTPNEKFLKSKYSNPKYRFRISESYMDLPEQGEIINSLFGIPMPFRGGEVLFHGGLKLTSQGGVVVNMSGKPGVGKTSVALSLSALLAPLNTQTIYISLEEECEDLFKRLLSLVPEYLKELSSYIKPDSTKDSLFTAFRINEELDFEALTELVELIKQGLDKQQPASKDHGLSIPTVCPLYVVIDNINELAAGYVDNQTNYKKIENFIIACRNLGALVMLISSEDVPEKLKLNYLVDISIHAKQTGTDNTLVKPSRIFELNKTRHQISRQGSHIFHLTGSGGFRVCPQIPSQMDKKENLKKLLPDKSKIITTLNIVEAGKNPISYNYFLNIFPNSQILLHGQGSSGKAGLGLKILFTPPVANIKNLQGQNSREIIKSAGNNILKTDFSGQVYQRKVLIISFLYPKEYYEDLVKDKIIPSLSRVYKNNRPPKFKVLPFFPGYLTPEDFVNKIIRNLDEAILEGEPYTGVMLDGLHNVFLQFKNLQDNDMVWPLLYSILSRYRVTVISTFTNFKITSGTDLEHRSTVSDHQLLQKGQTPLLHSMVKASDFYIGLEEIFINNRRTYQISIRSAIDQNLTINTLDWNRQMLSVEKCNINEPF
jgi:KaiC/GvpD/RAD55 family RecA-like ATPase